VPTAISDFQISPVDGNVLTRLNTIAQESRSHQPVPMPEIAIYDDFAPIEHEWLRLESDNRLSLHQSLAWCKAWSVTHNSSLALVMGRNLGQTIFILPLEIVHGPVGRKAQFIGAPFANINTGLFTEGFATSANAARMEAVMQTVKAALRHRADMLQLTNVPAEWRGLKNPFALAPSIANQNCAYQLPLLGSFEQTLTQINAKRRRKKFNSCVRHLNAVGGFDFITAETPADKRALLQLFFRQKAVRFQALNLPNVFKDAETQGFFDELLRISDDGINYSLRLHAIRLRDEHQTIVSIAGLSRKGDHIICQFGSINESMVPEASPGELLFHLMIEKANSEGAALFDFGIGDQAYKRSWCPVETRHRDILAPLTTRGAIGVFILTMVTRLKAAIKNNKHLYAALQKFRARNDP